MTHKLKESAMGLRSSSILIVAFLNLCLDEQKEHLFKNKSDYKAKKPLRYYKNEAACVSFYIC